MRAEKEQGFSPGFGFGLVLDLAADCGQPPLSSGAVCLILDTLLAAAEYETGGSDSCISGRHPPGVHAT